MATRSHPESARIIREARQAAGLTQLDNHSEGRRICQEMTVDFVPVKLMRKYY